MRTFRKSKKLPSQWLQERIADIGPKPADMQRYFESQLLPFKSLRDVRRYEKAFGMKGSAKRKQFALSYRRFRKKRFRLFEKVLLRLQNGSDR